MNRLMMTIAIAVAANFAGFGIHSAAAVDAHHPAGQAAKGKNAKKAAPKKVKRSKSSGMQMQYPTMAHSVTEPTIRRR